MVHYCYHKHTILLNESNDDTARNFFLQLARTYNNANKLMNIRMHIHDSRVTTMALAD